MKEKPMAWQLQEAKAKFSELVQKAIEEGPQTVTRRGKPSVVVLSIQEYERLRQRKPSLKEVLMSGPEGEFELPPRVRDSGREIDF
jgi:prevent-host-death family protein